MQRIKAFVKRRRDAGKSNGRADEGEAPFVHANQRDPRFRKLSNYEKMRNMQLALATIHQVESLKLQNDHVEEMQSWLETISGYHSKVVILVLKLSGRRAEISRFLRDDHFAKVELIWMHKHGVVVHVDVDDYIPFRQDLKAHFLLDLNIIGSIHAGQTMWNNI